MAFKNGVKSIQTAGYNGARTVAGRYNQRTNSQKDLIDFHFFSLQYLNQCEDLSNYYLGFNSWTSKTLYHQKEAESEGKMTYGTAVKLTFKDERSVEGVGIGTVEYSNLQEKVQKCGSGQKASRTAAMINAFSKVILVFVHSTDGSSKITVRIDQSRKDPFYYNSIWDTPTIENVNELDEEPQLED